MVCPIAYFGINYFGFQSYFALAYRPVFYLYTFKVRSNSPFSSRHTKYENRQDNKASKTPVILHATNYLDRKKQDPDCLASVFS